MSFAFFIYEGVSKVVRVMGFSAASMLGSKLRKAWADRSIEINKASEAKKRCTVLFVIEWFIESPTLDQLTVYGNIILSGSRPCMR